MNYTILMKTSYLNQFANFQLFDIIEKNPTLYPEIHVIIHVFSFNKFPNVVMMIGKSPIECVLHSSFSFEKTFSIPLAY